MSVASAPKLAHIAEQVGKGKDPKTVLQEAIGDLSGAHVVTDLVLVATYVQGDKRVFGGGQLFLPPELTKEDEWQGKVGLVVKRGPYAYGDWEDDARRGENAIPGTWVVFAIKDAWPLQVNGVACRVVPYDKIRMRVEDPKMVF